MQTADPWERYENSAQTRPALLRNTLINGIVPGKTEEHAQTHATQKACFRTLAFKSPLFSVPQSFPTCLCADRYVSSVHNLFSNQDCLFFLLRFCTKPCNWNQNPTKFERSRCCNTFKDLSRAKQSKLLKKLVFAQIRKQNVCDVSFP